MLSLHAVAVLTCSTHLVSECKHYTYHHGFCNEIPLPLVGGGGIILYHIFTYYICYEGDALMMVLLEICKGLWSRHHVVVIVCCISL